MKPSNDKKFNMKWIAVGLLLGLCGCAGIPLRHAYNEYSDVYADLTNRQLLLNLARLSRNEPSYFIQLGQISSAFSFSSSIGFAPTFLTRNPLGGNIGGSAAESPSYQFVPLTGAGFANAVAAPIHPKLFYTWFDQGFNAEIIARTMLASVTVKTSAGEETYVNMPHDSSYPNFLAYCRWLREAQVSHYFSVSEAPSTNTTVYTNVRLPEVVGAIAAGLNVKSDSTGTTFTVSPASEMQFTIDPPSYRSLTNLIKQPNSFSVEELDKYLPANAIPLKVLAKNTTNFTRKAFIDFARNPATLKMRTFETTLFAVAREEAYFRQIYNGADHFHNDIIFTNKNNPIIATVKASTLDIPLEDVRPILTLTEFSPEERRHLNKLVEIDYKDTKYIIGDEEGVEKSYNRSVFSLISYLYAIVGIDPQKLPIQQLIQVH